MLNPFDIKIILNISGPLHGNTLLRKFMKLSPSQKVYFSKIKKAFKQKNDQGPSDNRGSPFQYKRGSNIKASDTCIPHTVSGSHQSKYI